MAYREFDQPKVDKPESVDFGILGHILGGVDKFPHHLIGGDGKGKGNKRPSYKIDTAKAPFQKDQELIGQHVNAAIEAVNRGENPEAVLQKAEQVAAMSQAQKNALEQSKAQTNELQQAYGNAIDPTPINNSINSAYNDHDINTRSQVLGEIQKNIADPSEKMFNSEKHTSNIFLSRPEQSLVYSNKDENGNVNTGNERKVTGRILVPDNTRPQYEWKNNKKVPLLDGNGQPVYEMRNASTIEEAIPEAKSLFEADRNYADWTTRQVARSEKGKIDELTAEWISSERNRPDGGVPSKEIIEAKKQLIARDLAERKVAKQLLQLDRPAVVSSNTRSLDEQIQPVAGSLDKFTLQTASSTPQQNLVRQRTTKMSNGTSTKKIDTYTYHTPMKSVNILDDKGNQLKVSLSNVSGTNETTGGEFASAQTVEAAPLNSLNFAIGNKKFKNGKAYVSESNVSADKSKNWYDGVNKTLSVENIKKELLKGNDTVIYPWAEVSVPKRKNDLTDLSTKDKLSAERLQVLSKIPASEMSEEERIEYGTLHVKFNEYIDHNLSTDASNIPQLNQYAKKKGFQNVSQMLQASMTPEERAKFRETSALLEKNKAIARKEIEQGNTGATKPQKTIHPEIKLSLIDQIKKEMPNATPEQWVVEYKKRSK
jgi:bifunctional DNA-binding transcriptional regulator/antitoxin component of YhaV-PrlF toxin-antitoxin module